MPDNDRIDTNVIYGFEGNLNITETIQQQEDAMIIHRYLTGSLGVNTTDVLEDINLPINTTMTEDELHNKYHDLLEDAMMNDIRYKSDGSERMTQERYDIFKDGWNNRVLDELEVFFWGEYNRDH